MYVRTTVGEVVAKALPLRGRKLREEERAKIGAIIDASPFADRLLFGLLCEATVLATQRFFRRMYEREVKAQEPQPSVISVRFSRRSHDT